ncbi:class III lanthionine synthetase LanKC [Streptomyces ureilyticus]|uniref:non-specific serine/threonine protein kinase n=1 Tax=Streptomyces ureilyticus TaxID=1775131 RepID=A0ABX0DW71_9ACTN|nr:class III lanthionine synthetase LanKC [Streptomyces ureilyticus]NGO45089.1 protein kinase/lanthionine synthetase C family protein [Streptomyces ureilyticus]
MSLRHVAHCPPGTPFYDRPAGVTGEDAFPLAATEPPAGWTRDAMGEWTVLTPADPQLPTQGWKIHVSATAGSAPEVLDAVRDYCFRRSLLFKFLTSPGMLMLRNSKYGDRGSSGKFITVYPRDEAELHTVLEELDALIGGRPGPAVLSDLRWRRGPLYVRYGGFTLRMGRGPSGESVPCIEDPDGNLVPDVRGPAFRPPAWVRLPPFIAQALADRNKGGGLGSFPFKITQALHFSNGGGVYRATDTRDGRPVLVKEGRPYAGLDDTGADAVARLRHEHDALVALDGLPAFPGVLDWRKGNEHWFLTREFVDGEPLGKEVTARNPLVHAVTERHTAMSVAAYTRWSLDVLDQIEAAVTSMHEHGLVFGDLHPNNVLIRPDGTVAFIDLETTRPIGGHTGQAIGAPGFAAPAGTTGPAVDRYALGCLRLSTFLPLTALLSWAPRRAEELIARIAEDFPVPEGFGAQVRADLGLDAGASAVRMASASASAATAAAAAPVPSVAPATPAAPADDPLVSVGRIGAGVLASATPERTDRLFPGDADQFSHPDGGLNIANGAAGVLWALHGAGIAVPEPHVDWLAGAARRLDTARPGLYDGLAGIACVLQELGRPDEAAELLDRALTGPREHHRDGSPDHSLAGGTAGLGMALLHLADRRGDDSLAREAHRLAEELADELTARLPADSSSQALLDPASGRRPGLLRGGSGEALFLLAAHGPDRDLLDAAHAALTHDLLVSGRLPGGPRTPAPAPWHGHQLAYGGAGQAIAVHTFLAHHRDPRLTAVQDALLTDLTSQFHPACGLFTGKAGALAALVHTDDGSEATRRAIRALTAGLDMFAVPQEGGTTGFLGDHLLRLSTDLASGSAGVLAALNAARTGAAALPCVPLALGTPSELAGPEPVPAMG